MNDFDFNRITSEKPKKKEHHGKGVFEHREEKGFPHRCKKCGYEEADVADLGISYSDESAKFLFRCKKCGYVERYAEGSSNN
jgi:DNA-directed RNA polymerase subunit M/transcription elongation factor TFIIS